MFSPKFHLHESTARQRPIDCTPVVHNLVIGGNAVEDEGAKWTAFHTGLLVGDTVLYRPDLRAAVLFLYLCLIFDRMIGSFIR